MPLSILNQDGSPVRFSKSRRIYYYLDAPAAALGLPADTETYTFADGTVTVDLVSLILNGNTDVAQIESENRFVSRAVRSINKPERPLIMAEGPNKLLKPYSEQIRKSKPEPNMKRAVSILCRTFSKFA